MDKKIITTEEFLQVLKFAIEGDSEHFNYDLSFSPYSLVVSDCVIEFTSESIDKLVQRDWVFFKNCEFKKERLVFNYCDFSFLRFNNCEFTSGFDFVNSSGQIHIIKSHFKEVVKWIDCTGLQNIQVEDTIFDREVYHYGINQNSQFAFKGNTFESIFLLNGKFKSPIILENNIFKHDFILGESINSPGIDYETLSQFHRINFKSGEFRKRILIHKVEFTEELLIVGKEVNLNSLQIRTSIFNKRVVLGHLTLETATIYGGKFLKGFVTHFAKIREIYISGGQYKSIDILEGYLEKIQIENYHAVDNLKLSEACLQIENLAIKQSNPIKLFIRKSTPQTELKVIEFDSTYLNKDSVVQVYDLELTQIKFNYFLNLGNVLFNNVSFFSKGINGPNFILSIINSDLGKMSFIDCDSRFYMFNKLYFSNSKILELFLSNNILPEQVAFPEEKMSWNNSHHERRIRVFEQEELLNNQLKKLSDSKSDISNSIKYKSKSHDARRRNLFYQIFPVFDKELRPTFVPPKFIYLFNMLIFPAFFIVVFLQLPLNKTLRKKFFEWATLCLNQVSNNHGSSWQRALAVTVVVISGCYTLYCYLAGIRLGSFNNPRDMVYFTEILSYSGDFLNPIQRIDVYEKFYNSGLEINFPWARIWGFISRIIIAYFIFQTVQAFRRYGK